MVRIYDYTTHCKDSYLIREGSTIVLFNTKEKLIQRDAGLRFQLMFLYYSIPELKPGTKQYKKVLKQYEKMLSILPLPNRYQFRVLQPDTICKMEEQLKELRISLPEAWI